MFPSQGSPAAPETLYGKQPASQQEKRRERALNWEEKPAVDGILAEQEKKRMEFGLNLCKTFRRPGGSGTESIAETPPSAPGSEAPGRSHAPPGETGPDPGGSASAGSHPGQNASRRNR